MEKRRVRFSFPPQLVTEPVIYNLGKEFGIVTNIRRANVTKNKGWVVLELEGREEDIESGIAWITTKGVKVDPIGGDVMEG
ncbi:MAG: NIL domain-containing protein [Chloroflexi bacterium]|nr:NIL domain-containing protein [Chloroflexota bacterium]